MNSLHGVGGITPSRSSSSRRSSSAQFTNASTLVGRSPLAEPEALPALPKHTPESVACNYFAAELELHKAEEESKHADTIVILHDACFGHRFSRPQPSEAKSKAELSTIVERPERINASILGISVAYTLLGGRHADGQYPPHPEQDPSDIPGAPFKIQKTSRRLPLSAQAVTNVHGVKWMEELKIMCQNAESRLACNGNELDRPDMHRATTDEPAKFHQGDLYLCSKSLDAMEGALGAVCEGVDAVFEGSNSGQGPFRTFVVIRPPGHHCSASFPSGFCWVNNVHVGIQHAALTHGLTHAAIIDFDLHHGDGSQSIAWESNRRAASAAKNAHQWKKTSIGYFSLHDINSYPCEQGNVEKITNASVCIENAHNQSIWNVHLQPWKSEAEFWELYDTKYSVLLEKTRNYLRAQTDRLRSTSNGPKPKGAIFLSAGFDASEWESSGMQRHKVNVPTEFYARLTRDVVRLAAEEGCAVDGRVISVLEGGYSDRALCTGVLSHLCGMTAGEEVVIQKEPSPNGLGYEMGRKIGAFNGHVKRESVTLGSLTYNPSWWSIQRLEQLDAVVNPSSIVESKKPKVLMTPTFSSPTQSFIAKVKGPSRRSSYIMSMSNGSPRAMSRTPSPPPEVDWTVAAHELSKLLIPSDRVTSSCQPEDLAGEGTRIKRERQVALNAAAAAEAELSNSMKQMSLRSTRAKPLAETVEEHEFQKPPSRASRRRTDIGAVVCSIEQVSHQASRGGLYVMCNLTHQQATSRGLTQMPISEVMSTNVASRSTRRASIASTTESVISEVQGPIGRGRRLPSNGISSALSRPTTSQSIRPESSASVRNSTNPPIIVDRRRTTQPRSDVVKVPRTRKKSPLNDTGPDHETPVPPPSTSASTRIQPAQPTALKATGASKVSAANSGHVLTNQQDAETEKMKAKPRSRVSTKKNFNDPTNLSTPSDTVSDVGLPQPGQKETASDKAKPKPKSEARVAPKVTNSRVNQMKLPADIEVPRTKSSINPAPVTDTGVEGLIRGVKNMAMQLENAKLGSTVPTTKKPITIDMRLLAQRAAKGQLTLEQQNSKSKTSNGNTMDENLKTGLDKVMPEAQSQQSPMLEPLTSTLSTPIDASSVTTVSPVGAGHPNQGDLKSMEKLKKGGKVASKKPASVKTNIRKEGIRSSKHSPMEAASGNSATPPGIPAPEALGIPQPTDIPLPASSPPVPKSGTFHDHSDGFIAYSPEGPPPQSIEQSEPLRWLTPNTVTPSPIKKAELPVFTSTGAIPFAVPKTNGAAKQVKKEEEVKAVDIWDVPETPRAC
jgi:histone deacetylase HOS3